ncbi:hypothetical protein C1H46_040615 [Malus baccata]|uniref:Uncharacterized protein n=1 Tax=Malus baccata TaxID=106549 RepID=A0A540KHZ2_MALBA|nr:hypothetical protein C1H46_040615 [Malus baccata]
MSPEKFRVKLDLRTMMNMVESQAITLKIYKVEHLGGKQKTKFTFAKKYADEELGFSVEYQTQMKFKESVYPNKIGYSSSNSNYNKNCNSFWKLMRVASATEEFLKISMLSRLRPQFLGNACCRVASPFRIYDWS